MKEVGVLLGWGANALSMCVAAYCLGILATGGVMEFGASIVIATACVVLGLVWLGRVLKYAVATYTDRAGHRPNWWRAWAHYAMIPGLAFGIWLLAVSDTGWPMRLLLATHRATLEREARDPRQITPRRVVSARLGLLALHGKRRRGKQVYFAVREGGFMSTVYFVLVYSPSGQPPQGSLLQPGDGCEVRDYRAGLQRIEANWFWQKETCSSF